MNDLMLIGFEELNEYEEMAVNGGSVAADATGAVGAVVAVVCGVCSICCICCLPFALVGVAACFCAANMCAVENGGGLGCDCGIVPDCCDVSGMTSCQGSAVVDLAAAY
ncbi:MAG: hypothetical protein LBT44_01405 [Clostridiales bacterium]|nr:hypothetical protein [Clostridiales bacterium]